DFSELMLQISYLSEKEAFYWFKESLKPWAKQDLCRQCITKPKETGNSRGDHEEDEQVKDGNCKNSGNEKPPNEKWKPNNKLKGPVKCFICDGLHIVRDCPKKFTLSVVKGNDELGKAIMRLGSIMHSIKAKEVRENEKKSIKYLCCGPHRMQDYLEQFKMSIINKEDEAKLVEDKVLKLGSMILNSTKAKRDRKQKWLMYVDINIAG
ncbi:hypothetical protein J1N35_009784, partial [Gossypium stocksii]